MRWENKTCCEYHVGEKELCMHIEITERETEWEIDVRHMLAVSEENEMLVVHQESMKRTSGNDIRHAKARAGRICNIMYKEIVSGEIYKKMFGEGDDEDMKSGEAEELP